MSEEIKLPCQRGKSGDRDVLIGFASASLLSRISFADVLDEETGRGYQRRLDPKHSLDFRNYIQQTNSATIPLTFNLRPSIDHAWRIVEDGTSTYLCIKSAAGRVLVQVDCQHRLGFLNDVEISLPFMAFINLEVREEVEIFGIINSKAKGLSTSLLDFHDATLSQDLGQDRPELFVALQLNSNAESPWYKQLDLGAGPTSGLMRRASLRAMQKAVKRFLNQTRILQSCSAESAAEILIAFWAAIAIVLRTEWNSPRSFLINKGIGVYALSTIAADLYAERGSAHPDRKYFTAKLSEFINTVDWSRNGPMKGLGGEGGVNTAVELIREKRSNRGLRVVSNG